MKNINTNKINTNKLNILTTITIPENSHKQILQKLNTGSTIEQIVNELDIIISF